MSDEDSRRKTIRYLNDFLRTQGIGGKMLMTSGVSALPQTDRLKVMSTVRNFDNFTADNDPYGEHDCAVLKVSGHSIIWKIDYYNSDMTGGSDDPTNRDITLRVMTIMLASEH